MTVDPAGDEPVDEPAGSIGIGRFALGLAGMFMTSSMLVLAILPAVASVVPGWGSTVVSSGSMEPALRRGDTVLYREVGAGDDIANVEPGTVVLFAAPQNDVIHRVIAVDDDGSLITQGDANPTRDSTPVAPEAVVGEGRVVVPWAGFIRLWWLEGRYELVVAALGVFVVSLRLTRLAVGACTDPWADDTGAETGDDALRHEWLWTEPTLDVPDHLFDEASHRRVIRSLLHSGEMA